MDVKHALLIVAVVAIVTAALRFLPFLVFGRNKAPSPMLTYFGKVLPFAIMGMLVVYCYRSINVTSFPFGLPEFIAGASVVVIHLWRRSTLLSIISGTALYMILIRLF